MQKQPLIYQLPGIPPFKMIHVPEDTFIMGDGSYEDNPSHEVHLDDVYLSEFSVTQDLYQAIAQNNPSDFKGNRCPIENVSWYDAVEFCNLLSDKLGLEKFYSIDKEAKDTANSSEYDKVGWLVTKNNHVKGFRLPTEAEWEFAAKSPLKEGGESTYAYSNRLEQVGWFDGNDNKETREVGLKFPNQLGIYEMSGNVWEWCWDWYGDYDKEDLENPQGAKTGSFRVVRGGSWFDNAYNCRVVNRFRLNASNRGSYIGFRLALSF